MSVALPIAGQPATEILTDPDGFFRERCQDARLVGPAALVLLVGLANVAGTIVLLDAWLRVAPADARSYVAVGVLLTGLSALVGTFAIWFLFAAILHVVSTPLGGSGPFGRTFSLVGWGFLPALFGSILYGTSVWYAVQLAPASTFEGFGAFAVTIRNSGAVHVASLLGVGFTFWQGFLWAFAVKHARELTTRRAVLVALVPVALSVLRWILA